MKEQQNTQINSVDCKPRQKQATQDQVCRLETKSHSLDNIR